MMIYIILNNTGGAIMESLELRIFREVAYTKSISKTAENMGYVQSNITAHIKKLEGELNTTLFIRHSKGVTLTKDGEKLLYQAEKIISLLDKTLQSFQNNPKTLKIGTTQTIAGYLLPKCIIECQKCISDESHVQVQANNEHNLLFQQIRFSNPKSYKRIHKSKECRTRKRYQPKINEPYFSESLVHPIVGFKCHKISNASSQCFKNL